MENLSISSIFLLCTVAIGGMGVVQRQSNTKQISVISGGGGYGDYCSKHRPSQKCDSKALLVCNAGMCTCLNQEEMIFDVVKGQCVAKAGSKCRYGRDEPLMNLRNQRVPCVLNAFCAVDGKCQCSSMFYNSFNVTCLPQKSFDVPCHFDEECRQDYNLKCVAGICQCNPAISTRHRKYEVCVGLAGENVIEGNCVEFSEKRSTSSSTCECQNGYIKNEHKRCLGSFNQPCTLESVCQGNFSCIRGTCQCPFPDYQLYKVEENKCLSNVFGPCSKSSDCVPEAICTKNKVYNECQCRHGFIMDTAKSCAKSHGMPCRVLSKNGSSLQSKQRSTGFEEGIVDECSSNALLQCRNGYCSCTHLKMFSIKYEKCVGLVGSVCVLKTGGGREEDNPNCVENAECIYGKFSRLGFGLCTCKPNFNVNRQRLCVRIIKIEIPENVTTTTTTTTQKPTTTKPTTVSGVTGEDSEGTTIEGETETEDEISVTDNIENVTNSTETIETTTTKTTESTTDNNIELEFARFFNDTLYGHFDNATYLKIMKAFKNKKIE